MFSFEFQLTYDQFCFRYEKWNNILYFEFALNLSLYINLQTIDGAAVICSLDTV